MIEVGGPDDLTPEIYRRVVYERAPVAPAPLALERVARSRRLFLQHLDIGALCYGVNTGLGALTGIDLGEQEQRLLSRHILLGRAAATGPAFPAAVARGAMLIKLAQFLTGFSAVTPDLCRLLADRLNDGFAPAIPSEGLGMAGEIIPLCHLAQALVGEGFVIGDDGAAIAASDWFAARQIKAYEPASKEGIALINGVAVAPAAAFELSSHLRRTLELATASAAAAAEGLGASVEAYDEASARLRPEPGVAATIAALQRLLAGSQIRRRQRQPPVSFRIVPQVHGACLAALGRLDTAIVAEWRAIGDNPVFIADENDAAFGRLLHTGNFHCATLTGEVEAASLAFSQVALLSERRLHRLLDRRISGLSPQLAKRPGLDAGLVILHKAALGLTARIKSLATPPSLMHGESSFGQEDVMTMIFPGLDRLAEIERLTRGVLVRELYAALVAIDERGETPGHAIAALRASVRAEIPPYDGDRPYSAELERLAELVEAGALSIDGASGWPGNA
jgi:histidine ammonia-lyase